MADPRNHYCSCGAWAPFGRVLPKGGTLWRCGLAGGEPHCLKEPAPASGAVEVTPAREDHSPDPGKMVAAAPEPDLFGGA